MARTFILLFFLSLFSFQSVDAQSWRWGQRGGSNESVGSSNWEKTKVIASDRNGNVYVLTNVKSNGINIAGQAKTGYGMLDIVLASFKCDGTVRWVKIFGGGTYNDYPLHLNTDKKDGVYIVAAIPRGPSKYPVNIDNDMTITSNDEKSLYIIKYDTSGNLKWVRAPQADTVTAVATGNASAPFGMDVDSIGNVYLLCQLPHGVYGGSGGFVTTAIPHAECMLKYDNSGNFLGGFKMEANGCYGAQMTRDSKTGKLYLLGTTGGGSIMVGSTSIAKNSGYIACFDNDGKYQWDKHSDAVSFSGKPSLDASDNIYLAGKIMPPSSSNPNANFNGYVATGAKSNGSPFIVKIKPDGNNAWATFAKTNASTFTSDLALRNSGEVILYGFFPGLLKWPGYDKDSFSLPVNSGYRPFITRFNTHTGKVLGMDQLPANGTETTYLIPDNRNNVYAGGNFETHLMVNGTDHNNIGGESDWFVAKYGHDGCGCAGVPEPKFSFNKTSNTDVSFTYTGSTYSTIEWDFDDGNTSTSPNPTHTYTDTNWRHVCVKVTNGCGDNTYCAYVPMWPDKVNDIISTDRIKVYPNPLSDQLVLEGIEKGTVIVITDVTGRRLFEYTATGNKEVINTQMLIVGVYILQLTDTKGDRVVRTIVK